MFGVLFYLFFEKEKDEFKKDILLKRTQAGKQMVMKDIYEWCQRQKAGFKMAYPGDSIDLGYATMNTRRGRVGHEIAHTLTTGSQQGTLHFVDLSYPPQVTEHGAKTNGSCGQHVHVDAGNHTPKSLKNALSIMYSKVESVYDVH